MTAVRVMCVMVNGYSLLNIRLWFYSLALLHLLATAYVTLTIDLTVDEDPKVRAYDTVRWNLLTCWFNIITIVYLLLCIYCDWREKCCDETPQMDRLRNIRDVAMTAILFPVTGFGDTTFWILFNLAPDMIAPPRVFEYLPLWAQHSLHTISFVLVFIDLLLTPRTRPKSHRANLQMLIAFSVFYTFVMYVHYVLGYNVYSYLETASRTVCILSFICALTMSISFYCLQWYIIEYIWGNALIDKRTRDEQVVSNVDLYSKIAGVFGEVSRKHND
ncbi:androgen-induced gene 1 protein-like [Anticarsia gemmatalis]|uniref:androgen-induced gene 1 protein-like n=1 Tax=Anticarsia gemmatalis TaxID=129554 RepID=UPI003F75A8CA